MTPDDLRQKLELDVVEMIKAKLADGTMTDDQSQRISQHVLDTLEPGMTFEQLYKVIPILDEGFPEMSGIILPLIKEYEENVTKQATEGVRELIRQGHYDAADKLAHKVIERDVKLVWHGKGKAKTSPEDIIAEPEETPLIDEKTGTPLNNN